MELFRTLSKYVSLFLGALSLAPASIAAELPSKPTLTVDVARSIVSAAGKKAAGNHWCLVMERVGEAPLLHFVQFEGSIALKLNRRIVGTADAPSRTLR